MFRNKGTNYSQDSHLSCRFHRERSWLFPLQRNRSPAHRHSLGGWCRSRTTTELVHRRSERQLTMQFCPLTTTVKREEPSWASKVQEKWPEYTICSGIARRVTRSMTFYHGMFWRPEKLDAVFAQRLWQFGILRCVAPSGPYSLHVYAPTKKYLWMKQHRLICFSTFSAQLNQSMKQIIPSPKESVILQENVFGTVII